MSQSKWDDLYERATSRKLLLCITSIVLAIWGYHEGIIDGDKMMTAISIAVTAYTAAEGASDAVAAWRTPSPTDAITLALIQKRAAQLSGQYPNGPADPAPGIDTSPPNWRYGDPVTMTRTALD